LFLIVPIINFKKSNNRIYYHYTAGGAKLVKHTVPATGTGTYTHYIGNIVYDGGTPSYIITDEGRLVANGNGTDRKFLYEYNLKDHPGNNLVVFIETPAIYFFAARWQTRKMCEPHPVFWSGNGFEQPAKNREEQKKVTI
jgi:hypothetical protein